VLMRPHLPHLCYVTKGCITISTKIPNTENWKFECYY